MVSCKTRVGLLLKQDHSFHAECQSAELRLRHMMKQPRQAWFRVKAAVASLPRHEISGYKSGKALQLFAFMAIKYSIGLETVLKGVAKLRRQRSLSAFAGNLF